MQLPHRPQMPSRDRLADPDAVVEVARTLVEGVVVAARIVVVPPAEGEGVVEALWRRSMGIDRPRILPLTRTWPTLHWRLRRHQCLRMSLPPGDNRPRRRMVSRIMRKTRLRCRLSRM
jgi:hypothetical protein